MSYLSSLLVSIFSHSGSCFLMLYIFPLTTYKLFSLVSSVIELFSCSISLRPHIYVFSLSWADVWMWFVDFRNSALPLSHSPFPLGQNASVLLSKFTFLCTDRTHLLSRFMGLYDILMLKWHFILLQAGFPVFHPRFWLSSFQLPSTGISGVCHHAQFYVVWGESNQAHASTLPINLRYQTLTVPKNSNFWLFVANV